MDSVRKGLRSGSLSKDNYGRLYCSECETELTSKNDPDELGTVRACPACDAEWQQLD